MDGCGRFGQDDRREGPMDRPERDSTDLTFLTDDPGTSRRRFLGYLLAAPTLVAAAEVVTDAAGPTPAAAVIPSPPEISDEYDLGDLQDFAAMSTANLITVQVNKDGTASFALPRAEVGQGITTAFTMLIADEMDLPMAKVHVHLEKARPALMFNQLTGGSNSIRSLYTPVRQAAAVAKGQLMKTAGPPPTDHWRAPPQQPGRQPSPQSSRLPPSSRSSASPRPASTPTTSSRDARSSRWTTTSPARCRR
jgi:hypothetical protein